MSEDTWVLVNVDSGEELVFSDRAEYLAVKYSGGWREKPKPPVPMPARQSPLPRAERPRREPVNDTPTVETAPGE